MGLTIADLIPQVTNPDGLGLSLDDLLNAKTSKKLELKKWLDLEHKWLNINNCYVMDCETYDLTSKIRMIQILNTKNRNVYVLINGKTKNLNELLLKLHLNQEGFRLSMKYCQSEKELIENFCAIVCLSPKAIVGQNFTHFDLGIISSKMQKYKMLEKYKLYFKFYNVGKSSANKHLFFTFWLGKFHQKMQLRYPIVDTMFIAQTLTIESNLRSLSNQATKIFSEEWKDYPKKEVNYKEFEKSRLSLKPILYAIYDILSIPKVYLYLKSIIHSITLKYLKIEEKASQLTCEHIWMKGAGSLSRCYMDKFLGFIDCKIPDFYTKYFGGLCRVWDFGVITSQGNEIDSTRALDFTSAYAFSIVKQGIFDILSGNFKFYKNTWCSDKEYQELIYSSIIELKCKKQIKLVYEIDQNKKNGMVSIGYLRSFQESRGKVSDLEHTFGYLVCHRGEKIILTKVELEINKLLNPQLFEYISFIKVRYGLSATSREKSIEYIQLFKERLELKKEGNASEYAVKQVLASSYGQLVNADSDYYHLACGSAIPAFQRFQLLAIAIKASQIGLHNLYSDTDSLYTKGTMLLTKKILEYANTLNEYPKSLFNVDNLKDEGENIICFQAIKRKRYSKVFYDKENTMKIKIKGENGNSDYRWRDILFRLSLMCKGKLTIKEIQECIKNKDFGFGLPTQVNPLELTQEKAQLKREIRELAKEARLQTPFEEYKDNFADDWEEHQEDLVEENEGNIVRIGDIFNETNPLVQDITIRQDRIAEINDLMQFQFLALFKSTYKKYREQPITDIIPELDSKAKITMMFNAHFKMSIKYNDGVYYGKIRKAWEQKTGEKAYIGCFFSINRLILKSGSGENEFYTGSFDPKEAESFSFKFNVSTYKSECDYFPILLNSNVNAILNTKIELDTIMLRTGETVPLWILNEEISKEFTNKSFKFGHSKIVIHKLLDKKAILLRLRIKNLQFEHLEEPEQIHYNFKEKYDFQRDKSKWEKNLPYLQILKGNTSHQKHEQEEYANTTLMYSNINQYKALVRFNKFRLFCKNSTIFNSYYYIDRLAKLTQFTLQRMFETYGIQLVLPRFRMIRQIDISHKSSKEFHKQLYDLAYKLENKTIKNEFIQVDFMSYASLTCYNKSTSAQNTLKLKILSPEEREYFEREKEEGYRSEIKFSLQRTIYESINYMFLLQNIDKEYFIQFLTNIEAIHKEKVKEVEFSSFLSGYFKFGYDKCMILFKPEFDPGPENMELYNQEMPLDPLEGRGCVHPPPLISQNVRKEIREEKIVRHRQKSNILDEKNTKWSTEGLLIGWNEFNGMTNEEITKVMQEQGFSEKQIEEMIEKLWELQVQADKIQYDVLTRF